VGITGVSRQGEQLVHRFKSTPFSRLDHRLGHAVAQHMPGICRCNRAFGPIVPDPIGEQTEETGNVGRLPPQQRAEILNQLIITGLLKRQSDPGNRACPPK